MEICGAVQEGEVFCFVSGQKRKEDRLSASVKLGTERG